MEEIIIKMMRAQAWEKAKGELHSILQTYCRNENFYLMKKEVDEFIKKVEYGGLIE